MSGEQDLDHLDRLGRATVEAARRPAMLVYGVLAAAIALSWAMLGAMALRSASTRVPGFDAPGDSILRHLPDPALPGVVERFLALCMTPSSLGSPGIGTFSALTAMWFLMAVAMMLPSAAPMIRTYCEIADTAGRKSEPVVHPLVLASGYLAAWLAASAGFAIITLALDGFADNLRPVDPVHGTAGAVALAMAGLYQFSGLKQACLKKCRNPFSTLFARWSARPWRIFRLGLEQGMWCLGCCWALMLVMFAVGTMNLFWMALIGLFAVVEKQGANHVPTWMAGAILLVWAAWLLLVSA